MTTHELAHLLDHLQIGLGSSLKARSGFAEVIEVFRELPNQSLKELAKSLRKAHAPPTGKAKTSNTVPQVIDQIRAIRAGSAPATPLELAQLNVNQLKEILRAFQQPDKGKKLALLARVQQLVTVSDASAPSHAANPLAPAPLSEADLIAVEEGLRLFTELRDNKALSLTEVRAEFERLRQYKKPVIEEISRRLNYTPHGSQKEMLDRLLANLESIKMSQYRTDQILANP